ncbi:MAG: GDP-mannose 4,6-dehydratase [Spirochaetia bacterium]|nr:GDP-mannose 4,6-dehydratase [Spirochaetia bacterium]
MHFMVTGGAGFIGSHMVYKLLRDGHFVTVIDNFSTGKAENLPIDKNHLKIIKTDIQNSTEVFSLDGEFDGIFHLAALVSVPESIENPEKSFMTNSCGTFHMLEFARRKNVPRFIFASSAAVYGNTTMFPVEENNDLKPLSPYGLEKMHGEWLCQMYSHTYGIKTRAMRFFNVFGPRQDHFSPYSGVISIFINHLRSGKQVTIYGDGLQTRDFVFVSDVVDALYKSMTDHRDNAYEVYNVGTGTSTAVIQLYNTICEILNLVKSPDFQQSRHGDIKHSHANISRIQSCLGYHPRYSLKEGLIALIQNPIM